jgi:hypothetical protein
MFDCVESERNFSKKRKIICCIREIFSPASLIRYSCNTISESLNPTEAVFPRRPQTEFGAGFQHGVKHAVAIAPAAGQAGIHQLPSADFSRVTIWQGTWQKGP